MADVLGNSYRCDAQAYAIDDSGKDVVLEKLHFQVQAALQLFLQPSEPV